MAKAKGSKKTGGRQKGVTNKINSDLKAMILGALDKAGGETYLFNQAHENPKAFLALIGRALPLTVSGDPQNPLNTKVIIEWKKEE